MPWERTVRYQTFVDFEEKIYRILCEKWDGEDFALYINGEYICDLLELPTNDELVEYIKQYIMLDAMGGIAYYRRSL